MDLSKNTQATLLLTAYFNKASQTSSRPLTITEWARFAAWLVDHKITPEDLMTSDLGATMAGWNDSKIPIERLQDLLARGAAMGLALEKWSRAGIWVLSRSDTRYPARLKKHLKAHSPPVLFGCGNMDLLNAGGIAVIGSRNTSDADLQFSKDLGKLAADSGHSIVSGGARGVDEAAMLGALEAQGTSLGVLADSLLKASSSRKYRQHLLSQNLVLVSPFNPESGFNAGNAMQRNKYIYCLSDAAVAVHSGTKGGTWTGALENMKKGWVPMWVKRTEDTNAGNAQLVAKGGCWLSPSIADISINDLRAQEQAHQIEESPELPVDATVSNGHSSTASPTPTSGKTQPDETVTESKEGAQTPRAIQDVTLYEHFILIFQEQFSEAEPNAAELSEKLELHKSQVGVWLKRAVSEERLIKLAKPVRYRLAEDSQQTSFL